MTLEDQLRQLLGRRSAPPGFTDRVMQRVREEHVPQPRARRRQLGRWGALAASLLLAIALGLVIRADVAARHREEAGLRAARQVRLALAIASRKTNLARERVLATVHPLEQPLGTD